MDTETSGAATPGRATAPGNENDNGNYANDSGSVKHKTSAILELFGHTPEHIRKVFKVINELREMPFWDRAFESS